MTRWTASCAVSFVVLALVQCGGSGGDATAVSGTGGAASSATSAASASSTTGTGAGGSSASKPNIVFILADDFQYNLVEYMPNLQQMQKEGTTFQHYFVANSLCCPSRTTMFSGRFSHNTGVFTNASPDGGYALFHNKGEEAATFATSIKAAGYQTSMLGKYLNGYDPTQVTVPPGWADWNVAGNGYPEFNYDLLENKTVVHYGAKPKDYLTDVIAKLGIAFMQHAMQNGEPFQIELATFAPHAPYVPAPRHASLFPGLTAPHTPAWDTLPTNPPSWIKNFAPLTPQEITNIDTAFRMRAQAVQAIDEMIANVRMVVDQAGQTNNTYFIFTGDNGYHMGDHRELPGKQTAFDTDISLPLVVVGPGVPKGATVDNIVQNTDLCPTFVELAGAVPPPSIDGRSLVPLIHGDMPSDWRNVALIEHHGKPVDPSDPDLEPGKGAPDDYEAIRMPTSVFVHYQMPDEIEYYDLTADPYELNNIAGTLSPSKVASLKATLQAIASCTDAASCWKAQHM